MGKIIGISILVAVFLFWRRWRTLPSENAKRKFAFQAIVAALLITVLLLSISGRIHPLGAVFAALVFVVKVGMNLLIRFFPLIAQLYGANHASPRSIKTSVLDIEFNIATGKIDGSVLEGEFKGSTLDSLNDSDLKTLLNYCSEKDGKSVFLLRMYMAYRFKQGTQGQNEQSRSNPGQMSVEEAASILGVSANAPKDEVNQVHRRLIGKVHPDKGGNDYLASLLNQARDTLLKNSD